MSVPRTSPVAPSPREFLLLNAADTNQAQPEAGPSFTGDLAGGLFPTIPLTPCLATASRHGGELDAVGGSSESPRFVSRGAVRHTPGSSAFRRLSAVAARHPGVSISDDILRCGDRWTRFFTGIWGPAPRSVSVEYWVHHMGREKALSAVLPLQHDAGLILSNVQVMQQLVTALNRTSSDVLWAVLGRQPFPANAMPQVMPSYRVRRAAHYMMVMGLWRPPVDAEIRGPLPSVACNAWTSCRDCFPEVPM